MKWITRSNVKVDWVVCPWLIRRFVDPEAQFLFVLESELLAAAKKENATPFDAPRLPERAIAEGFSALQLTDEERLARGFPVYDALYEHSQRGLG